MIPKVKYKKAQDMRNAVGGDLGPIWKCNPNIRICTKALKDAGLLLYLEEVCHFLCTTAMRLHWATCCDEAFPDDI